MSIFPYCPCDIYLKLEQKYGWNKSWIIRTWNTISQIKFKTAMLKSRIKSSKDNIQVAYAKDIDVVMLVYN